MKREPVVAGTFYPLEKNSLLKEIDFLINKHELGPKGIKEDKKLVCGIVPHAGYVYSGAVAAHFYSRISKSNFFIIGPNHYGVGYRFSIFPKGVWITPLGKIKIDESISQELIEKTKILKPSYEAFLNEHSIEVQLPFLQYRFNEDFQIVAIDIINDFPFPHFLEASKIIAKEIVKFLDKWKVVVTTDFSHYVPHEIAKKIDERVIQKILELDTKGFFRTINRLKASLCGFVSVAIAIEIAKILELKPILYKYATSGDITKDYGNVVGYACVGFKKD